MSGTILSAGALFSKAKSFYQSSQYKQLIPTDYDQSDALAAIIFSALSIESFLNEVSVLYKRRQEEDIKELIQKDSSVNGKRKGEKSTLKKLLQISKNTSDTPLTEKSPLCQNLELLIDLRNRIVHLKAGDTVDGRMEQNQTIISNLQKSGILIDTSTLKLSDGEEFNLTFIILISTQVVAEWSCNVVADVINFLVDGMRESEFKKLLKSYMGSFEPVCKIPESELVRWHSMIFFHDCNNLEELLEKIKSGQLIVTKPTQENKKVTLSCYIFNFLSKFKRFIKWDK